MKKLVLFIAALCACTIRVRAEGDPAPLIGRWTNDAGAIEFFDLGVGREERGTVRSFCFNVDAAGKLHLRYGAGSTSVLAFAVAGDVLMLVDGTSTSSCGRAAAGREVCPAQLLALEAAKSVFLLDHPGETRIALADLIPAYLRAAPACPSNGVYVVGPANRKPSCVLHGIAGE